MSSMETHQRYAATLHASGINVLAPHFHAAAGAPRSAASSASLRSVLRGVPNCARMVRPRAKSVTWIARTATGKSDGISPALIASRKRRSTSPTPRSVKTAGLQRRPPAARRTREDIPERCSRGTISYFQVVTDQANLLGTQLAPAVRLGRRAAGGTEAPLEIADKREAHRKAPGQLALAALPVLPCSPCPLRQIQRIPFSHAASLPASIA